MLRRLYGKQESPCSSGMWFHIAFLPIRTLPFLPVQVRSRGGASPRWYWISYLSACLNNNSSPKALQQSRLLVPGEPIPALLCIPAVRWGYKLPEVGWAVYIQIRCFRPFFSQAYIPHNLCIPATGLSSCVYWLFSSRFRYCWTHYRAYIWYCKPYKVSDVNHGCPHMS